MAFTQRCGRWAGSISTMRGLMLGVVVFLSRGHLNGQAASGDAVLKPKLAVGQTYSNVFSILHSISAEGYDEYARRNGGSADYTVFEANTNGWIFRSAWRYDGQPAGGGETEIHDFGRTQCTLQPHGKENCQPSLDASGLLYNPLLWGDAPKRLTVGMTWMVNIRPGWELGGANGTEKVTVISLDPRTNSAVLMREGTSEGIFGEDESRQRTLTHEGKTQTLEITPGKARWKGYSTFQGGVVFSDELLVSRDGEFHDGNGKVVHVTERWIMLLNAAPFPTLG